LNAEFQRTARREKKAFLSDQCKEVEGNNRMGKTRDLFKKIRDTKGTFHAKMGTIKDRNGMDLTEAKDIYDIDIDTYIDIDVGGIDIDINDTDRDDIDRNDRDKDNPEIELYTHSLLALFL